MAAAPLTHIRVTLTHHTKQPSVVSTGPAAWSVDAVLAAPVDVDSVDGTDVHTQHTVDTLVLAGGVCLLLALGVTGRVDPVEHVDGAVLDTGPVRDADVEVHRDVRAVDPRLLGLVDRAPHVVALVVVDAVAVGFEVRVDSHHSLSGLRVLERTPLEPCPTVAHPAVVLRDTPDGLDPGEAPLLVSEVDHGVVLVGVHVRVDPAVADALELHHVVRGVRREAGLCAAVHVAVHRSQANTPVVVGGHPVYHLHLAAPDEFEVPALEL